MTVRLGLLLSISIAIRAQIFTLSHEQMLRYTAENPFDRFPDGRPKVPDDLLEKAKGLSIEEVWSVLPGRGYRMQYAGEGWKIMHPEKKLIGRAVTLQFMPMRPDLQKAADPNAAGGPRIAPHQRFIDMLQQGDVAVVDLYGKIEGGTVVGDNLATAIWNATKRG
jgi:4-hydroxy-4-methyl-2-oxoglutarate aldolase